MKVDAKYDGAEQVDYTNTSFGLKTEIKMLTETATVIAVLSDVDINTVAQDHWSEHHTLRFFLPAKYIFAYLYREDAFSHGPQSASSLLLSEQMMVTSRFRRE